MEIKNKESRLWRLTIYEDFNNELYSSKENIQDYILKNFNIKEYSIIKHDKDFNNDTGELKKSHYHILLKFYNPIRFSTIVNRFFIPTNNNSFVEFVRSYIGSLKYLIHYNDKSKYQYDITEILSNIPNLKDLIKSGLEDSEIILDTIDNYLRNRFDIYKYTNERPGHITFKSFIDFAREYGSLSVCFRHVAFIREYLKDTVDKWVFYDADLD